MVMAIYEIFTVLLGLAVGSFLQVCIVRWPEDRSVIRPLSHCPVCGHRVRVRDNIPLISWILLRGRCRDCGATIPATYPLTEALTGVLAWLLFRRLIHDVGELDLTHAVVWVIYFTFVCMLIIGAFIDLKYYIIPDEVSIYAVPVGILGAVAMQRLGYDGWLAIEWRHSVVGATVIALFLAFVSLVFRALRRREGLGWGDVKLMMMIGAFLGLMPGAWFVLMVGSIGGSIFGIGHLLITRRRIALPFGPSLALAALLYVYYGDVIIKNYLPAFESWL